MRAISSTRSLSSRRVAAGERRAASHRLRHRHLRVGGGRHLSEVGDHQDLMVRRRGRRARHRPPAPLRHRYRRRPRRTPACAQRCRPRPHSRQHESQRQHRSCQLATRRHPVERQQWQARVGRQQEFGPDRQDDHPGGHPPRPPRRRPAWRAVAASPRRHSPAVRLPHAARGRPRPPQPVRPRHPAVDASSSSAARSSYDSSSRSRSSVSA